MANSEKQTVATNVVYSGRSMDFKDSSKKLDESCPVCRESGAPMYHLPDGSKVCGDCIDRYVDAHKEAEAMAHG